MAKGNEFAEFEKTLSALVKVPHGDVKAKLDAEKKRKKRKKTRQSWRALGARENAKPTEKGKRNDAEADN